MFLIARKMYSSGQFSGTIKTTTFASHERRSQTNLLSRYSHIVAGERYDNGIFGKGSRSVYQKNRSPFVHSSSKSTNLTFAMFV